MEHRPKGSSKPLQSLRERAESAWQRAHKDLSASPLEDITGLVHELQVHQIELELQNEELRRAQIEVQEARDHFLDLYDFAPVGYLTLKRGAVIAQANLKAAALLGVERGLLVGQRFSRFLAPESRDVLYRRPLSAEPLQQSYELVLRNAHGARVPVLMETVCAAGPDGPSWRCTIADITELKAAGEKLRESEQRLAAELEVTARLHKLATLPPIDSNLEKILKEILEAVVAVSAADFGDIQLLDPQSSELRIVAHSGLPKWWVDYWGTVTRDRGACGAALAHGRRIIVEDVEQSPIFKDKDLEMMLRAEVRAVQSTPLVSRVGELLGIFSTHYRAPQHPEERTLRLLDLFGRGAADVIEHARAVEGLREADRRKDEFLALLGHELRNPLAAMFTSLQVLFGVNPPAQRAELQEVVVQQMAAMRRLLDDLLDIERIAHGHIELKKERIDLDKFLHKAAAAAQSVVAQRGQSLFLRLLPEPVQFMADPTRLEQVVANLLSNASKYTPVGGKIELSGSREGSDVVFRCSDNGQGILPENLEKIFEPFARGRMTELGYGEASLGLGLALARRLIELHEGTITPASGGAGMGSEFTVRIPLVQPPQEQPLAVKGSASLKKRKWSFVVVEDNPNFNRAMQIALELAGHEVMVFRDGPSALSSISEVTPDAILLDIGLPDMDGYEVLARMRAQPHLRGTVFMAISGFQRRPHTENSLPDFDYYLVKPVDMEQVCALLAQHRRDLHLAS